VNISDSGKALCRRSVAFSLRKQDLPGITYDDLLNVSSPVCKDSDLPSCIPGYFRDIPDQFGSEDLCRGDSPSVNSLDIPDLAWFQPQRVSIYFPDVKNLLAVLASLIS